MTKPAMDGIVFIMNSANQIFEQAMLLPEDQRLSLAHKLLADVEPEWAEEVSKAWDLEIRDRIARYDSGESSSSPASEVFKKLDAHLQA